MVFLGLLFLLTKFAWGPLSQALHQREEHLEHCLLQTEKARNESEQLLAEHRRLMAQADDRVKALFDKAQQGRPGQRPTRSSSKPRRRRRPPVTAPSVRSQRRATRPWRRSGVRPPNVAVSVAGRVLAKDLDDDEHRRLLDLAIQELPASPASGNGHGGALGMTAKARTAPTGAVDRSVLSGDDAEVVRHYAEALVNAAVEREPGRGGARRARGHRPGGPGGAPEVRQGAGIFARSPWPRRTGWSWKSSATGSPTVVLRFLRVLNRHGRLGLLAGTGPGSPADLGPAAQTDSGLCPDGGSARARSGGRPPR